MTPTPPEFSGVKVAYDYRFGVIRLGLTSDSWEGEASVHFRLDEMLRVAGVLPYELDMLLGVKTQPDDFEPDIEPARRRAIEESDLKGKTVLDIGGYDGWAAKLALDCGAARAICLDNHQYEHYGWEEKKHEEVQYVEGDFMAYRIGEFDDNLLVTPNPADFDRLPGLPRSDILIFYNVLYHLKNPWAALERLRELVKPDGEMLFSTLFRYHEGAWAYLYEPKECNPSDETVFWGLSLDALERLVTATGWDFQRVGLALDRVVYRCKPTPNFKGIQEAEGWARS